MDLAEHTWGSAGAGALLNGCGVCGAWPPWRRWCWITNQTRNPTRYRSTIYRCGAHLPAVMQGEPYGQDKRDDCSS
jgi:hypothetical protein